MEQLSIGSGWKISVAAVKEKNLDGKGEQSRVSKDDSKVHSAKWSVTNIYTAARSTLCDRCVWYMYWMLGIVSCLYYMYMYVCFFVYYSIEHSNSGHWKNATLPIEAASHSHTHTYTRALGVRLRFNTQTHLPCFTLACSFSFASRIRTRPFVLHEQSRRPYFRQYTSTHQV